MAYATRELFSSTTTTGKLRFAPTKMGPKTFKNVAGAPVLAIGTPVAYDTATDKWVVWTSGGATGMGDIRGFVWPDAVPLDATGEVLGQVMLEGRVHYADIPLPAGETAANLKTSLRSGPRERGLWIEGVENVR